MIHPFKVYHLFANYSYLMKRILLLITLIGLISPFASSAATHRFATYNIRYTGAATDTEGKDWGQRGPICRDVVTNYDFDVVGFQEVSGTGRSYKNPVTGRTQLEDLKAWLPDYEIIEWDRDGDKRLEYVATAFKKNRYELIDQGSFFISPTPDKYSMGWDPAIETHSRILGWLKLKEKESGQEFIYATTHTNDGWSLDGPLGSQLVAERIKKIAGNLPVMVVADYNTSRTASYAHKGLKAYHASFHDAALDVPADKNYSLPVTNRQCDWTYNAFHPVSDPSYTGSEIDYQFYKGMKILERHIVTEEFTYNGSQYPSSDHFPIFVVAELAPVEPKAIYVDCNASEGGDGSKAFPFRTFSEAMAYSDINDTIYATEGVYNESIHPINTISILGGYDSSFTKVAGTSIIDARNISMPPIYSPGYISLTIKNMTLCNYTSSKAEFDGALLFRGSDLNLEAVIFENNTASEYGGGLSVFTVASKYCECNNLRMQDCIFRNNSAANGGAFAIGFYDKLDIDGCSFENNNATMSGGAGYIFFGTPEDTRIWFTEAEGLITNSSFTGNTSKRSGTLYISDDMPNITMTIVNSTFAGNTIDAKGGLASLLKTYGGTAIHSKLANCPSTSKLSKVKNSIFNLGHVTVIGNHATCTSPANFKASAITVGGGIFRLMNSVVAANTTNGTDAYPDITIESSTTFESESRNIFTSPTSSSFQKGEQSLCGSDMETGTNLISNLYHGTITEGRFIASVFNTDAEPTPFVPLRSTMFGTEDLATLTVLNRNLEREFNIDIDRDGTVGTQTKTDQLGFPRNGKSMPGAVEFRSEYANASSIAGISDKRNFTVTVTRAKELKITADTIIGWLEIYDITGNKVFSKYIENSQFNKDISGLYSGIYVIICLGKSFKKFI